MRIERIRELLGRVEAEPGLVDELVRETSSHFDELAVAVNELSVLAETMEAGANFAALDLFLKKFVTADAAPAQSPKSRRGDPLVSVQELAAHLRGGEAPSGMPEWGFKTYNQFNDIVGNKDFPCLFGKKSLQMERGWICFVDQIDDDEGREEVRQGILNYYNLLKRYPAEGAAFMPLLIAIKPVYPALHCNEYNDQAWKLFQYLHDHDPEPWPEDVPTDPDHDSWAYCFGGIQFFANVSNPGHLLHKGRNLGDSLIFVSQPRRNFDMVAGPTPKGRAVRETIRQRQEKWENGRPRPAYLHFYSLPGNRIWMQMAVPDDEVYLEKCPLKIRPDKSPGTPVPRRRRAADRA